MLFSVLFSLLNHKQPNGWHYVSLTCVVLKMAFTYYAFKFVNFYRLCRLYTFVIEAWGQKVRKYLKDVEDTLCLGIMP